MAFDPTQPTEDSELDAAQMRGQLNGLKEYIDALAPRVADLEAQLAARPTVQQVLDLIAANAARNVDIVAPLPPPWSENPPDRAEFNETRDKVNEVLGGLKHPA